MIHPAEWPGLETSLPARSGLLSPPLRRDLADLNLQYLGLGLDAGAEADPRFGWDETIRANLRAADAATRERLAAVPFALFELVIPLAVPRQVTVRVEDACLVARNGIPTGRCESFAHQAAFLARQLAESGELVSGVVFAFAPEARRWLLECRPSQLAELARHPAAIRPRWRTHAQFWQLLVGAACRSSVAALEWAHCIGLCLIGAEVATPAADGRRRQRP
jgi:hypothetical protein